MHSDIMILFRYLLKRSIKICWQREASRRGWQLTLQTRCTWKHRY